MLKLQFDISAPYLVHIHFKNNIYWIKWWTHLQGLIKYIKYTSIWSIRVPQKVWVIEPIFWAMDHGSLKLMEQAKLCVEIFLRSAFVSSVKSEGPSFCTSFLIFLMLKPGLMLKPDLHSRLVRVASDVSQETSSC